MKKELKKHKNSNIIDADLRNLTRNIFRKQPIDMILEKNNDEYVKVEGLEVTPEFASLTEKTMKARASARAEKNERLKDMLEMTEIWTPPTATPEEQSENKKKYSSFISDNANNDTKTNVTKPRKQRKKQRKLEVSFIADKKLGLDIIFESDIKIDEQDD